MGRRIIQTRGARLGKNCLFPESSNTHALYTATHAGGTYAKNQLPEYFRTVAEYFMTTARASHAG
jgi:hypothetical protein